MTHLGAPGCAEVSTRDLKELENGPALLYVPVLHLPWSLLWMSCSALMPCHGLTLLVLSVVLVLPFAHCPSSLLQTSRNRPRAIATPCSSCLSPVLNCDLASTVPRAGHVLTCHPRVLALLFCTPPAVPRGLVAKPP